MRGSLRGGVLWGRGSLGDGVGVLFKKEFPKSEPHGKPNDGWVIECHKTHGASTERFGV